MTKNNSTLDIKIPNDSIIQEFKKHLELDFNQRILFTAPFGAGKSTFMDDFKDANEQEYRFVRLYPINYAVASNEDIFELVKFDILYELMAHHQEEINLEKEDFTFWLRMSMFMKSKSTLMPLFLHIISLHESIGKPVAKFIEVAESTVKDFKQFSEEIKVDELEDISKFLGAFKNQKGSPFEMDTTSQFIYNLIDRLKGKELEEGSRKNKTILVIDDLDRLDPDHIFRLFNIFSAHTHSITGDNKFGFDKIIFVCDIDNIRKIYAHKYGQGVDFSGYMDKFYSIKPFEFDNLKYLAEKIFDIINDSTFKDPAQINIVKYDSVMYTLTAVLKILSKNKVINLRSLLKNNNFMLSAEKSSTIRDNITLSTHNFPLYIVFEIVKEMLGDWFELEIALLSIKERLEDDKYYNLHQKFLDKYPLKYTEYGHEIDHLKNEVFKVFVAEYLKKAIKTTGKDFVMQSRESNLDVIYTLEYEDITDFKLKYIREIGTANNIDAYINYDLFLVKAFKKLKEYGLIPNTK